jgi:ABC-type enterochelin transport system ATPase subunit
MLAEHLVPSRYLLVEQRITYGSFSSSKIKPWTSDAKAILRSTSPVKWEQFQHKYLKKVYEQRKRRNAQAAVIAHVPEKIKI